MIEIKKKKMYLKILPLFNIYILYLGIQLFKGMNLFYYFNHL